MSKRWKTALLCLLAVIGPVALYAVAWMAYVDYRLKQVLKVPGAQIVAGPYELIPVPAQREIDVGYATFSLPATVDGDPVRLGSSAYISIVPKTGLNLQKTVNITVCPPYRMQDDAMERVFADYNKMFGGSVRNRFEWESMILAVRPFSIWDILRIGRKEAVRRVFLLATKGFMFGNVQTVGIGKSDGFGFIVMTTTAPKIVTLTMEDLNLGWGQRFLIDPKRNDATAIISSLVRSYQLDPNDISDEAVKQQLDRAQLKSMAVQ